MDGRDEVMNNHFFPPQKEAVVVGFAVASVSLADSESLGSLLLLDLAEVMAGAQVFFSRPSGFRKPLEPESERVGAWFLLVSRSTVLVGVQSPEASLIVTAGRGETVLSHADAGPMSQVPDPGPIQQQNKMEGQDGGPPFCDPMFQDACHASSFREELEAQSHLGCLSLFLSINSNQQYFFTLCGTPCDFNVPQFLLSPSKYSASC